MVLVQVNSFQYCNILFLSDGCLLKTTVVPSSSSSPELDFHLQWPETAIGAVAEVRCPCQGVDLGRVATRLCGGDFDTGGRWEEPIDTPCNYSDLARKLCLSPEV